MRETHQLVTRCKQGECLREMVNHVAAEELELAANAWHLARFVQEHQGQCQQYKGKKRVIIFPDGFDCGLFMERARDFASLNTGEKQLFLNDYAALEKSTGIITARTLVATRRSIHLGENLRSPAFRHLLDLMLVAVLLIAAALFTTDLASIDPLFNTIFVFSSAGLGATVYLLRVTQLHLKLRSFEVSRIPGHYVRLLLGMVAGGSFALFPELSDQTVMEKVGTGLIIRQPVMRRSR